MRCFCVDVVCFYPHKWIKFNFRVHWHDKFHYAYLEAWFNPRIVLGVCPHMGGFVNSFSEILFTINILTSALFTRWIDPCLLVQGRWNRGGGGHCPPNFQKFIQILNFFNKIVVDRGGTAPTLLLWLRHWCWEDRATSYWHRIAAIKVISNVPHWHFRSHITLSEQVRNLLVVFFILVWHFCTMSQHLDVCIRSYSRLF